MMPTENMLEIRTKVVQKVLDNQINLKILQMFRILKLNTSRNNVESNEKML